jgi:hypothetical protein
MEPGAGTAALGTHKTAPPHSGNNSPSKQKTSSSGVYSVAAYLRPVRTFLRRAATTLWNILLDAESEDSEDMDEDIVAMQENLHDIFVSRSPTLYFFTVEFALLAQCLYLALWATNFVMIARDSYYPRLWEAALLVPVPLNFWLIQKIIFSACTLKAVVSLDRHVADKICEEALDARNVTERLRKIVRSTLAGLNFEKIKWNGFLHEQFHLFKKDGAVGITEKELRLFLHSLQIFLTSTSVSRIFSVIDFDRDGKVTWKDLSDIVFPELAQQQLKVNRKANSGKSVKAGKSVKHRKSKDKNGKSFQSTPQPSPKFGTFGASSEKLDTSAQSSDSEMKHIRSFRPGAALAGTGIAGVGLSESTKSADFGASTGDLSGVGNTEYTTTKRKGGVMFASTEPSVVSSDSENDARDGNNAGGRYLNCVQRHILDCQLLEGEVLCVSNCASIVFTSVTLRAVLLKLIPA